MTDGVTGALARMRQLDSRIRAFDPSWAGGSEDPFGATSGAGWGTGATFSAALTAAGSPAAASTPVSVPVSRHVSGSTDGSTDAAAAEAGGTAEAGNTAALQVPDGGPGAGAGAPNANALAWAIPAASFHAQPVFASGSTAIASSGTGASTASIPAGAAGALGRAFGSRGASAVPVQGAPYVPPLVSERIGPPPYTDCSWAALAMLMAKASDGTTPTTAGEVRALRAASGDLSGGSTSTQNILGARNRYGFALTKVTSRADALRKLSNGWGAKLNLTYPALPAHLRRWDADFTGNHSVYVQDYDAADGTVLWLDPLAPAGSHGERVKLADITRAVWWDDVVAAKQGSFRP
jgi:hypothetical protein